MSARMLVLCVAVLFSLLPLALSSPSTNITVSVTTPYGLVYDGHGNLFTSQTSLNTVLKLSTSGAVLGTFSFASSGYTTPRGLDIDNQGNLYVAQQFGPNAFGGVIKFSGVDGRVLSTLPMQSQPFGVTVTPDMSEWVADAGENAALQFSSNGTLLGRTPTLVVYSPHGIASDLSGILYIMSAPTNVNPTGYIIQRQLNGTYAFFASGFAYPEDLVVDYFGNVFVADTNGQRVVKLSPQGQVLATFTPQDVPFQAVTGVAVDELGNLYAADYNNGRIVKFAGATGAIPTTGSSASVCLIAYGLPGTVDYPWSSAITLNVQYNATAVNTANGPAYRVLSGAGARVFTNRFGASTTTSVTVDATSTDDYLYTTNAVPVDASGLTLVFATPQQLPGQGSGQFPSIDIFNSSIGVLQGQQASIDPQAEAYLSTLPGFVNKTLGASNINTLAVNYAACMASVSQGINNGRPVIQPTAFNAATRTQFTYTLTDGATYSVTANLTLFASSGIANTMDSLGNPFQTIVNITGTHTYTVTGGATTVSTVRFVSGVTQRIFPFSFINAPPGVYTQSTAPFLDATGLTYTISPATPAATVTVAITTNLATGMTGLTESDLPSAPVAGLTQQTFTLLQ